MSSTVDVGGVQNGRTSLTRPPHPARNKKWSDLDQRMIQASRDKQKCNFVIAIETDYTDNDGNCKGLVMWVDVDSYKLEIEGREIWLCKPFVVSVEPLQ